MDPQTNSSSPSTSTPSAPQSPPITVIGKARRSFLVVFLIVFIIAEIIAVAGLGYAKYAKRQEKPSQTAHVKIGLMMAFSGGSSSMGFGASKGVALAKKQLSADNIDVIQADSKCDAKSAIKAIKKLIDQGVIAIIGEGCSSASVAALPSANNAKIPMVSPSASSTALSIPRDYFFRVVPPDTFQGAFMAQAIYNKGIRKVGVFYTNEPYGSSLNKVFKEKFEALGGKVVATAFAETDVLTLNEQMNEIKAANPEAVFFASNSVVSGTAALKVGREVGITAPFFGADFFYDSTIIENAPEAVEGLTITSFPAGSKAFKQAIANEYPDVGVLYAASQAYDAFHAIYQAVQEGATTGEQVKNKLSTIQFQGVSAYIKFDDNGEISDPSYKYDLLQIKNGKFTPIDE